MLPLSLNTNCDFSRRSSWLKEMRCLHIALEVNLLTLWVARSVGRLISPTVLFSQCRLIAKSLLASVFLPADWFPSLLRWHALCFVFLFFFKPWMNLTYISHKENPTVWVVPRDTLNTVDGCLHLYSSSRPPIKCLHKMQKWLMQKKRRIDII